MLSPVNQLMKVVVRPIVALSFLLLPVAAVGDTITYQNIADVGDAGSYARTPSSLIAAVYQIRQDSLATPLSPMAIPSLPNSDTIHGLPGVAIFDHDGDGDLDFYVTNGPGTANSLYSNQLIETGSLGFVDLAGAAGAELTAMNSAGVCFGDIDNDGDHDLFVAGHEEDNALLENLGGTFSHIPASGTEGGPYPSTSCAMGDINGDGLLDIVVVSTFGDDSLLPIFAVPFDLNAPNQLYLNQGGGSFVDVSDSSGFTNMVGLPPGAATISWAVGMVDYDEDGDIDIIQADDQGGFPTAKYGGLDRGYIQVFENDGTGHFTNYPINLNPESAGSWMGLGFGDVNCDGTLDILGSNFGDYNLPVFDAPYELGDQATRLHLGDGNGAWTDAGVGNLGGSAFGWGSAVFDHDNDGDSDLLYHGSLEMHTVVLADNPGVLLSNDGCGQSFSLQQGAFSVDHTRRNVHGAAIGDLDNDGFNDIISVSNLTAPPFAPLLPSPVAYGSIFDSTSVFVPTYAPTPAGLVWTGLEYQPGDLKVEIASGNDNRWVSITAVGTVGITTGGEVNRDGIGAVVSFTPRRGDTVKTPVQAGSTFLSQHSLELGFGLGDERRGTVEILWPGGTRNRLYNVRNREQLRVPELPCGFDADWPSFGAYMQCVGGALNELEDANLVNRRLGFRMFASAVVAYFDAR